MESPHGILLHVLIGFQSHVGLQPSGELSPETVEALRAFGSFFALPETGCDGVIDRTVRGVRASGQFAAQKVRCGALPCKWVSYCHQQAPETRLGARMCSDHVGLAERQSWFSLSEEKRERFAVWEVMTT